MTGISLMVHSLFLPVRRYATAGTSYGPTSVCVCVYVCLSRVGVLLKRMDESGWFLAWELPLTYPTVCRKEIQVSSKIRALPSRTLHQSADLENLAAAYRSSKRVTNLTRERWTLTSVINWTVVGQLS